MESITASQLRAARGLLGWSQKDLAQASKVGRATIADFETGKRAPYTRTLADLQRSMEDFGVEFLNGDEPGVRMKRSGAAPAFSEQPAAQPRVEHRVLGGEAKQRIALATHPQRSLARRASDHSSEPITPDQVRAARELLGWSEAELAAKVGVSETAISLFERLKRRLLNLDVSELRRAFEAAGLEFTDAGEPSVEIKSKPQQPAVSLDTFLSGLDQFEQNRLRPNGVRMENRRGVKFGFALLYTSREAASLMLEGRELGNVRWVDGQVEFAPQVDRCEPPRPLEDDLEQWASRAYEQSLSAA
jgi:transcriptional regulator with XRE-family HTH domain